MGNNGLIQGLGKYKWVKSWKIWYKKMPFLEPIISPYFTRLYVGHSFPHLHRCFKQGNWAILGQQEDKIPYAVYFISKNLTNA